MSIPIDHRFERLQMANSRLQTGRKRTERSRHQPKRNDILPDDVLLGIFDFYMIMNPLNRAFKTETEAWQTLVHVCRRWRLLVFTSPRRLNLRLVCTPKTPARDTLDMWPTLPLIVMGNMNFPSSTNNVIAALGQSSRVCVVNLWGLAEWKLEEVLVPMQVPFPDLTDLRLWSHDELSPVIPDSFLDGSAPRLQSLELGGISFLGLPKLLLSATHLVHLTLFNIPHSGYISPEAMVALLYALSSLEVLCLEFQSPESRPDWGSRSLPPQKRSILPALHEFRFQGVTEYLEDFVTSIDAPQLCEMGIIFFNQINFDCPRLAQFIYCTPTLRALDEAHMVFRDTIASVVLSHGPRILEMAISCSESDLQLSPVAQVCNFSLPHLSAAAVEDLYIQDECSPLFCYNDNIEDIEWLELLLPFTAVKNLYICNGFVPYIAVALQELVGARITEVLPVLQNIFVDGLQYEPHNRHFQENIWQFAGARRQSGHPIAICVWDRV